MKKIFNTPEVNMMKMEAAQVIAASAQSGIKGGENTGIGNGGNTSGGSGSGFNGVDARQGGVQDISAMQLN